MPSKESDTPSIYDRLELDGPEPDLRVAEEELIRELQSPAVPKPTPRDPVELEETETMAVRRARTAPSAFPKKRGAASRSPDEIPTHDMERADPSRVPDPSAPSREVSAPPVRAAAKEAGTVSNRPRRAPEVLRGPKRRGIRAKLPPQNAQDVEEPIIEPPPRNRFAALGTDAAGAAFTEHALHQRSENLAPVKHPALKRLRPFVEPLRLTLLDRSLAGNHAASRALEKLIADRTFAALPSQTQANLLSVVAIQPENAPTIEAVRTIVQSEIFGRLQPTHAAQLALLLEIVPAAQVWALGQLAHRRLGGRSALEDRDHQGTALIIHLCALPPGDRASVIEHLDQPEQIPAQSGPNGVLGTLAFGLADSAPAEYARLSRSIAEDASTLELAGGTLIQRPESGPSTSLHSALLSLAPSFLAPGGQSLDAQAVCEATSALFGRPFRVAAGPDASMRSLERAWAETGRPIFVSRLGAEGERLFVVAHFDAAEGAVLRGPGEFPRDSTGLETLRDEIGFAMVPHG